MWQPRTNWPYSMPSRGEAGDTKSGWYTIFTRSCWWFSRLERRRKFRMSSSGIVHQVVGDDRGQGIGFPALQLAAVAQAPVVVDHGAQLGQLVVLAGGGGVEQALAHLALNGLAGFVHLIEHGAALEHLRVDAGKGPLGDEKHHHLGFQAALLQAVVEAGQGLQGQVEAFVVVLVAARGEEVQRVVEVEGVGLEEVRHHELVNAWPCTAGAGSGTRAGPRSARC